MFQMSCPDVCCETRIILQVRDCGRNSLVGQLNFLNVLELPKHVMRTP